MVKTCTNCRYDREGVPSMHCHGCYNHSNHEPMPQTNADRIRAMSDEELAEILFGSCLENMGREQCNNFHNKGCKHCVVEWLKSEAKEGENEKK